MPPFNSCNPTASGSRRTSPIKTPISPRCATELTSTKATLDAIMPSQNIYNINPNQSLIAADGRLTIGMVGSPGNEGINLNVNGKQQKVAAGDVIRVSPDPSSACQVQIQSFDMFKAVLVASCARCEIAIACGFASGLRDKKTSYCQINTFGSDPSTRRSNV